MDYLLNNSLPSHNLQPFDFEIKLDNLKDVNLSELKLEFNKPLNKEILNCHKIVNKVNDLICPNTNEIIESRKLYGKNKTNLKEYLVVNNKINYFNYFDNRIINEYKLIWINCLIENGINFNNGEKCKTNHSFILDNILSLDETKKYSISKVTSNRLNKKYKNHILNKKYICKYIQIGYDNYFYNLKKNILDIIYMKFLPIDNKEFEHFYSNLIITKNNDEQSLVNDLSVKDLHLVYEKTRNYYRNLKSIRNEIEKNKKQTIENNIKIKQIENKINYKVNLENTKSFK